jgi:anhydro-N-acetylmuramic acid kinase
MALLREAGISPAEVRAIGHHGQTVFHKPAEPEPFTMQIGDPSSVAALTGITTVADFRRLDVACGGQGAPLVPAFHSWLFAAHDETRVILNIGGIANVTVLAPEAETLGFDTGPGNTLLDLWIGRCHGEPYDRDGRFAASGRADEGLLRALLDEPYFSLEPPKSTGRELFNAAWLDARLAGVRMPDTDIQATLAELTASSIAATLDATAPDRVIGCGGGAHNTDLLARLRRYLPCPIESSAAHGLAPDWVEACAFAWLAKARLEGIPGNVPTVTGAHRAVTLGGVYCAAPR